MKTYQEFITEAPTEAEAAKIAPGISPEKRRAALERNARRQAARDTPTTQKKQKALPAGNQGGGIQKRTTSSIVKPQSKSGGLAKRPSQGITKAKSNKLANPNIKKVDVKVDKPKFQAKRPGTTRTTTTTTTKPETTTTKPETTTTTRPSNTSSEKPKAKERKFGLPQVNKLDTSDVVSTGSVKGLNFKNQD